MQNGNSTRRNEEGRIETQSTRNLLGIYNNQINCYCCFMNTLIVECAICTNLGNIKYNPYKVYILLSNKDKNKVLLILQYIVGENW